MAWINQPHVMREQHSGMGRLFSESVKEHGDSTAVRYGEPCMPPCFERKNRRTVRLRADIDGFR